MYGLLEFECILLSSARQAFINSDAVEFHQWDLHQFAISKNREEKVKQAMVYSCEERTREGLGMAGYITRFVSLQASLSTL